MTVDEKNNITQLRAAGISYAQIAFKTGINENTVKTFCRRNGLRTGQQRIPRFVEVSHKPCRQCGVPVIQYPGRKEKKFCCDSCRNTWWNTHLHMVKRDAMYEHTCLACGDKFYAYGNKARKYCCHECYIKDRFG